MSEHYDRSWTTDVGPLCAECHSTFPCKPYLTEQVDTLTARLTELEGADIALEDAIAEMRRMREERDEERRKFDKQFAKAWDAIDRALTAEQRVKELEGQRIIHKPIGPCPCLSCRLLAAEATADRYKVALERIAEKSSYKESDHRALALDALTGTEPGEGT